MTSRLILSAFASCVVLSGCSDRPAVLTQPLRAQFSVAGASGCYTVALTTVISDVTFAGSITGDLEGTIHVVFDQVSPFTGVTNTSAANVTWTISGGIIPELVGKTFTTRLENRNVLMPGSGVAKNIGTLRAISGVATANLNYTGETPLPPVETRLNYHGVICPS